MGNMDYPDILHLTLLSSGFVQSVIHSSNIINNVAVFFPFNLTGGGGGGGGWLWCLFLSIHLMTCRHLTVFVSIHLMTCTFDNVSIHLMTYTFDSVCVDPSHDSTVTYYYWLCLSSHLMTCRHFWQCVHPSHDLQTLLTMFVSIHLMTCRHVWQVCSSISWPADTFNSIYVLPSHDLQTLLTVCVHPSHNLHTFNSVCIYPSHDLRHFWQYPSISWPQTLWTMFVSIYLMTCRHIWQCVYPSHDLHTFDSLSSSISWPAYTFDNACVHPSHDLQTLLTMYPSISWPAHTFDKCVHPSHDMQTLLTVFVFISWPAHTFDSVCVHPSHDLQTLLSICVHFMTCTLLTVFVFIHLMTCRHIWQCLCPSISWPADTFDSVCSHQSHDLQTLLTRVFIHLMTCTLETVCVHSSHDLQTLLTMFVFIHLMTLRHFLKWALLSVSLDNTTFSFSIFYKLFPGYNLILMPLFCISGTMTKTRSPRVVPKFDDARESSRALVDDKESRTAADQRARNKLTS